VLNLIATSNETRWQSRPVACLIRKFSATDLPGGDDPLATNDVDVCFDALDRTASEYQVSIHLLAADDLREDVHVTRLDNTSTNEHEYELALSERKLTDYLHRDSEIKQFESRQLLVVIGLTIQGVESLHRDACLGFIRQLRQQRPAVYAQFVSWRKPDNIVVPVDSLVRDEKRQADCAAV